MGAIGRLKVQEGPWGHGQGWQGSCREGECSSVGKSRLPSEEQSGEGSDPSPLGVPAQGHQKNLEPLAWH